MSAKTPVHRSAALAALMITLAACGVEGDQSAEGSPKYDPVPEYVGEEAPEAEVGDLRLPFQFQESTLLDPGWDAEPKGADGVFLAPAETDGVLTFSAVDQEGLVLWEAQRPESSGSFTITSDGQRPLAVLTDLEGEEKSEGGSTASAYDLQTGEQVWGPVEVPGPYYGPGTVFAADPEGGVDEPAFKIMLDPVTGEVLIDESEDDRRVVGEYFGTALYVKDSELAATFPQSEQPQWNIALQQFDWSADAVKGQVATGIENPPAALVGHGPGEMVLIELETGDIISEELHDAVYEPVTGGWVTLGEQLTGYDEFGTELFSRSEGEGLRVEAAGAVMVYLRTAEEQLQVHNAFTGDIAQAYDPTEEGSVAAPLHISEAGGGILSTDQGLLLAPAVEPSEGQPGDEEAP